MSDDDKAGHEIDEVLLNVEQSLRRVSRAPDNVCALERADPELKAVRQAWQ